MRNRIVAHRNRQGASRSRRHIHGDGQIRQIGIARNKERGGGLLQRGRGDRRCTSCAPRGNDSRAIRDDVIERRWNTRGRDRRIQDEIPEARDRGSSGEVARRDRKGCHGLICGVLGNRDRRLCANVVGRQETSSQCRPCIRRGCAIHLKDETSRDPRVSLHPRRSCRSCGSWIPCDKRKIGPRRYPVADFDILKGSRHLVLFSRKKSEAI